MRLLKRAVFAFMLFETQAVAAEPLMVLSFPNEKMELVSDDIPRAVVEFDRQTSNPIVVVRISDAKAKELGPMTGRHIGEAMDVVVCGHMTMSPRIMDAIPGPYFQISGGFDLASAKALADALHTGICPNS